MKGTTNIRRDPCAHRIAARDERRRCGTPGAAGELTSAGERPASTTSSGRSDVTLRPRLRHLSPDEVLGAASRARTSIQIACLRRPRSGPRSACRTIDGERGAGFAPANCDLSAAARLRPTIAALAADRSSPSLSARAARKLRRAQDLMRHNSRGEPHCRAPAGSCTRKDKARDAPGQRARPRRPPHPEDAAGPLSALPVHRNGISISPRDPIRARRIDGRWDHRPSLPRAQRF